jgi:rubrerythrin
MGFEKDTIVFFKEMQEFVPEGDRDAVQACVEEERRHLRMLAGLLR